MLLKAFETINVEFIQINIEIKSALHFVVDVTIIKNTAAANVCYQKLYSPEAERHRTCAIYTITYTLTYRIKQVNQENIYTLLNIYTFTRLVQNTGQMNSLNGASVFVQLSLSLH